MKNLLLIGGGGHCQTVIESLQVENYNKIGIIDMKGLVGQAVCGIPFVGCDADLEILRRNYDYAFISFCGINNWQKRKKIEECLSMLHYEFDCIVHKNASLSSYSQINKGVLVGPLCIINTNVDIGKMCIINSGCIIEHGCKVESYVHLAPGVILCGDVHVGKGSHVGAGSVVKEGVNIGENSIIGIGSAVIADIPSNVVAYGNPCRVARANEVSE